MPILNIVLVILALWAVPWKIYAVWLACKRDQKKWFVLLLLLNTLGILEIFYIFRIAKKSWEEVKGDFMHGWNLFKHSVKKKKNKS
jgi:hypothetical protein